MQDNKELITYLIDNRIFESSASALASRLGYKGRMAFSRLKEGNIRTSTVDNIIDDICTYFGLDYSDLIDITEMVRIGKILYNAINNVNVYPDDATPLDTTHSDTTRIDSTRPDRILTDFVTRDFKDYPDDFYPFIPQLDELYRDRSYVYFGAVMFLYIKLKKIEPYIGNEEQFHCMLKEFTSHICSTLKQQIPENSIGRATSLAYLSDNIIRNIPKCIWGMMVNNIHLLRYFADPNFINNILEVGAAFDEWEDLSYWHETDLAYSEGVKLWTLFFRESASPLHGMYIGQTFEAGKDNETFIPKENFSLIFWNKENEDDEYATIQASNIINSTTEDYIVYYGLYKYDNANNEIIIRWNDEKENFLNIPSRMKRVTREKPYERNEQVWWNIIRRFDDNNSLRIFTENLLRKLETEYLDDEYDIQDVTISRKFFSLTIKTEGGIKVYSIPIDAYPFLRNLSVFDEVSIKKYTSSEELFVSWPWIGYEIPISEWNIT